MKTPLINLKKAVGIALITTLFLSSCQKKEDKDSDTNAAKNESVAERYFSEMNDLSDQTATKGDLSGFKVTEDDGVLVSDCAIITIDTSSTVSASNPNIYTIDFGSGCVGNDGKNRTGKIVITSTGRYKDTGTLITITSEGYTVNGNAVSGYRRITNSGPNSNGQPTFSIEVNGSIALANSGGTVTWVANRTRTWTAGYNTPLLFSDDLFSVTGSSSGSGANGGTWTTQITSPLVHKRSCHQIVSGTITITPSTRPIRTVDFGNGNCDNTATVTINGNTYTITIQ
jgi:hypothetical protein